MAFTEIIQAWLFFGLLIEVLKVSGVSVNARDFVHGDYPDKYITTEALPRYLSEWEQKARKMPEHVRKGQSVKQQDILMLSIQFRLQQISGQWWEDAPLHWVDRPEESYEMALPLPLQMSIAVLCETLDRAGRRFGNVERRPIEHMLRNNSLVDELKARAWCPSEISFVLQGLSDTSAFFASRLERRRLQADHSKCSANKCRALDIIAERYQTRHVPECRGCQNAGIDSYELAATLRRGQIPRACFRLTDHSRRKPIRLIIGESGPYVAISHVWSDGLGNPKANSLPTCQLIRLYGMINALDIDFANGTPAVWIDSLLVPVQKGQEKRLALSQLCNYYRAAEKVLVLDSDLLGASKACTREELITRVFFSTWMRRLWTLEEGILSRGNLVFQLCDGTVSLRELSESDHFSASVTGIGNVFGGKMREFLPNLADHQGRTEGDKTRLSIFADLLPALEYRSTTKAIDEQLCIAHILGVDARELVTIDDVQLRMKRLLELLAQNGSKFPMRLLFTKEPKLQLDGFRWVPTAFMAFEHDDVNYLRERDEKFNTGFSDKGLLIKGIGAWTLPFGGEIFKKVTYIEVEKSIFALTPVPVGQSCRDAEGFWTPQVLEQALKVDPAQHWHPEMQAMLGTSPETTAILFGGPFGMLVSIHYSEGQAGDPDGSLIYARPIGQFYMRELMTATQSFVTHGPNSSQIKIVQPTWTLSGTEKDMEEALEKIYDPETSTFLHSKVIPHSQRWCIG
ncbi:MAG: hypothetical protein HETSPECPRED_008740 [Heterodermia speciosa]|uniref:Heterokaryon incompatibility domain-containing protein n=1 Tax=Heterodermia speciosa TaxID=116794 RepID=A0A8H3G318_9LECA|nr:MAG: hypothetical protein HETSPECPRED_008740 [Heterodermia speciosa]